MLSPTRAGLLILALASPSLAACDSMGGDGPVTPTPLKRRGRRPASHQKAAAEPPAWLYHHLTVSGPAESVASFAAVLVIWTSSPPSDCGLAVLSEASCLDC